MFTLKMALQGRTRQEMRINSFVPNLFNHRHSVGFFSQLQIKFRPTSFRIYRRS